MELEFDKEMDALLRKARSGTGAAQMASDHLDADAIVAFAEGAVPAGVKSLYTKHFADCDRCRKLLSHAALSSEPVTEKAAAAVATAPWPPPLPWYSTLFRAPGLAAVMGILVLAFGAGLIYLVTQRNANGPNASIAESNTSAPAAAPYTGIEDTSATAANAASNSTANMNAARMPEIGMSNSAAAVTPNPGAAGTGSGLASGGTAANEPNTTLDGVVAGTDREEKPKAAAPPPPATGAVAGKPEQPAKTETDDRKDDKESSRNRGADEDRAARDSVSLSKKSVGGPLRGAGPVQSQTSNNAQLFEMPVSRRAGGKTFRNDNGAWYDAAYHGQPTINVRRGTDEYKKLDGGLRSIANDLGGVVVVVWKDKAYRIQ
ncbi:MAG TPA: hypothetical protein VGO43_09150 [Pyrinomonadaceae bacterium]|jgi:hypothetical protein|nr:hypothetical protein [Pyrinomonadaceae bacterium]